MKFKFQNLSYFLFAATIGLTSCGKDDENTPAPTATFTLNGTSKTTSYFNAGETAEFQMNLSGDNLSSLMAELAYTDNGGATKTVTVKDANNGNKEINFTKSSDIDAYKGSKIVKVALPSDAKPATAWVITVTAKNAGGTVAPKFTGYVVNMWSAKLLGAQLGSAGSYFRSSTGEVLAGSVASSSPAGVDITYAAVGSPVAKPSIISYKGRTAAGLIGVPAGAESSYFVETSLTASDFTSSTISWNTIINNTAVGTNEKVEIAEDKVYAFKNTAGKYGLIHIQSIVDGTDGSVTINVKAEK